MERNNRIDLTNKISLREIENINNIANQLMRTGLECVTFIQGGPTCPEEGHHNMSEMTSGGCGAVNGGRFTPSPETVIQMIVDEDCLNGNNGGGPIGDFGPSFPSNPSVPTSPTNPGSGSNGPRNPGTGTNNPSNPLTPPTNPSDPVKDPGNGFVTTPLIAVRDSKKPCEQLTKMATKIPYYKESINLLKTRANGTKEYAWAYKYSTATDSFFSGTIVGDSQNNPNQVDLGAFIGGNYVGAAHNHTNPNTTTGVPMFSPADINFLFQIARKHNNNGQDKDYSLYFLLLVVEGRNYAIKIKDKDKFMLTFSSKFANINRDLEKRYKDEEYGAHLANPDKLQNDFLKVIKEQDLGIGLYEEIETNGNKIWNELTPDPVHPNGTPLKKPCN